MSNEDQNVITKFQIFDEHMSTWFNWMRAHKIFDGSVQVYRAYPQELYLATTLSLQRIAELVAGYTSAKIACELSGGPRFDGSAELPRGIAIGKTVWPVRVTRRNFGNNYGAILRDETYWFRQEPVADLIERVANVVAHQWRQWRQETLANAIQKMQPLPGKPFCPRASDEFNEMFQPRGLILKPRWRSKGTGWRKSLPASVDVRWERAEDDTLALARVE